MKLLIVVLMLSAVSLAEAGQRTVTYNKMEPFSDHPFQTGIVTVNETVNSDGSMTATYNRMEMGSDEPFKMGTITTSEPVDVVPQIIQE